MLVLDPIYVGASRVADMSARREVMADGREVWRVAGTVDSGAAFNCYSFDLDGPVSAAEIVQVCRLAEVA